VIRVLGSGSRGNAILLEADGTRVLIDAGFPPRVLAARLRAVGVAPESIGAVIVTHEHLDHAGGVAAGATRYGWPVYATRGTIASGPAAWSALGVPAHPIAVGQSFAIGTLEVLAVRVSHDAAEPVALVATASGSGARVGIAYDLGETTEALAVAFERLDTLIIETNHDPAMLRGGPYPPVVVQRIGSRRGHLGNAAGAAFIARVAHRGLRDVILAHLSEICNTPALAIAAARSALARTGSRATVRAASQQAALVLQPAVRRAVAVQLSLPFAPGTPGSAVDARPA